MCLSGQCCGSCRLVAELTGLTGIRAADFDSCNLYVLFGFRPMSGPDGKSIIFPGVFLAQAKKHLTAHPWALQFLRHLEVLYIDELCFIGTHLMQALNLTLQWVKNSTLAFGNVQIIATADHYQIPAIDDDPLLEDPYFLSLCIPVVVDVRSQCPLLTELQLAVLQSCLLSTHCVCWN